MKKLSYNVDIFFMRNNVNYNTLSYTRYQVVPDYHKIIHRPMDLQTIRDNLRQKKYQSREEFLADVNQIVENSTLYNGAKSSLTVAAKRMLDTCVERLGEKEDRLMRLEKAINPLLDDDDQVALTFILENVINNKLKSMQEVWPFMKPVNKKMVKDYYNIIKRPMDLETISKKVAGKKLNSSFFFFVYVCMRFVHRKFTFLKII